MKKILVISNPEDEHTRVVVEKLNANGVLVVLLYPERLGQDLYVRLYQSQDQSPVLSLITDASGIQLNDIFSVWYRRPRSIRFEDQSLRGETEEFIRDEWRALLDGLYGLMTQSLWVSAPERLVQAARKPVQMEIARKLGLTIPRTLITNDPAQVKWFFEECGGKIVTKATGNGWISAGEGYEVVMTNRISLNDLSSEDEIRLAPATFQEEVPKAYEIRATVIGQQVYSIKIDSQKSEISELDWRRYDITRTPYTPYQLPHEINQACLQITKELGLEYGAIDLIRRPDGEYVFLEINGNGQFLWAEELSGVSISTALANLLAGNVLPLHHFENKGDGNEN